MFKILMVASEAVPFAKSGGLADVVGSLPPALAARGEEVAVVMPRYRGVRLSSADRVAERLAVWFGPASYPFEVHVAVEKGVPFFLVDCPPLFDRDGLYGTNGQDYPDNHLRFAFFSRAVLEVLRFLFRPRVIHCHDWQAALVAAYIRHAFADDPTFMGMRIVQTIHNIGYQGVFEPAVLPEIGLDPELFTSGVVECHGKVNYLKTGIQLADAITTVSRGYAREIQTPEYGFGLDALLRDRAGSLTGILNGVDYGEWNPETDPVIAANYSAADLSGKRACKRVLLEAFDLPADNLDQPVIGIVSRFAGQKGFDLIEKIAPAVAGRDLFLVALGTGDSHYEEMLRRLAESHPGKIAVRIGYDNRLAHQIEAGADMFLMPSQYEPCGLNQIYSLRYGTVPVVRATGGLDDTIDAETGFKFKEYTPEALLAAIEEALEAYADRPAWRARMLAGMAKDFSWDASAKEYSALYRRLAESGW